MRTWVLGGGAKLRLYCMVFWISKPNIKTTKHQNILNYEKYFLPSLNLKIKARFHNLKINQHIPAIPENVNSPARVVHETGSTRGDRSMWHILFCSWIWFLSSFQKFCLDLDGTRFNTMSHTKIWKKATCSLWKKEATSFFVLRTQLRDNCA